MSRMGAHRQCGWIRHAQIEASTRYVKCISDIPRALLHKFIYIMCL